MKCSSGLMTLATGIALSLAVASRAETIIVDSFDRPDVLITDHEGDILLVQKNVPNVLGGERVIGVGGYSGRFNSLEIGGGQATIDSAEGVVLYYGYSRLLNQSFEPDAVVEIDFLSAPWPSPQMFTVAFVSDGGDAIQTSQFVAGGSDFTFTVSASDLQPSDSETIPLVVLNKVDTIRITTPTTWKHSIAEIRIIDDRTSPRGDFDFNDQLDVKDVDLLASQIRVGQTTSRFDLDSNGKVQPADLEIWVHELKQTYFGDANLDGEFSSADLTNVLQTGEYEDVVTGNSGWATGDWSGDGEFTTSDLVVAFQDGGYGIGPRPVVGAVPEPRSSVTFLMAMLCVLRDVKSLLVSGRRFNRGVAGDNHRAGEPSRTTAPIFAAGEYEDGISLNSTWGTGDWDGDGDSTTSDLVPAFQDGGYEQGPRLEANAVPEPTASASLLAGLIDIGVLSRRRRLR